MNTTQKTLDEYKALLTGSSVAYERLTALFDEGTFLETGRFVKSKTTPADETEGNEFEGVVTGYGAVDGRLVFAYAQDPSRMKGAMSEAQAKKIVALYDAALKAGAPVVALLDSVGAKVEEGVAVLSGYASVMKAVASASGVIPQITVVCGVCSGSLATIASMTDVVVAVKDAKYYVSAPIALTAKGAKNAGSIGNAAENGSVSIVAEDAFAAVSKAKAIVALLPSNNVEGSAYTETTDTMNRTVASASLEEVADAGSVVELGAENGKSIKTALATVGGMTVGFVAVDGKICPFCVRKAAKFVAFCDSFQIPVVTLVNCDGTVCDPKAEEVPFAAKLAQLACVYASSTTAKVTVITGNAFGTAFSILGSKALGADVVLATENAKIAALPTEAGVEFLYGDEIKQAEDPAAKKAELTAAYEQAASPVEAARNGDIDDVIEASELRIRIAAALEMLSAKATVSPYKKHGNLPL